MRTENSVRQGCSRRRGVQRGERISLGEGVLEGDEGPGLETSFRNADLVERPDLAIPVYLGRPHHKHSPHARSKHPGLSSQCGWGSRGGPCPQGQVPLPCFPLLALCPEPRKVGWCCLTSSGKERMKHLPGGDTERTEDGLSSLLRGCPDGRCVCVCAHAHTH